MNRSANRYVLVAAMLLGACTALPDKPAPAESPPPPEPPPAAESIQTPPAEAPPPVPETRPPAVSREPPASVRAMEYFVRLKTRSQRERNQEQERLRKAFAASRSDHDRMRLALALSLPGLALESQALELLEPLVRDQRNEYHELAQLVSALLAEQRRRGEQAAALERKLERIKALEKEMQERSSVRGSRPR